MSVLRLVVLGGVDVEGGDDALTPTQAKRIALLTTVALSGATPISRDKVLGRLWPDAPESRARHALSNALYGVRRDLGAEVVRTVGQGLELDRHALAVDALEFEDAVERGELERAVDLYGGPLLDGFHLSGSSDFEHWLDVQRGRLATLYVQTLERLAACAEAEADHAASVDWWRKLAAHDRYSSRIALGLIRSLARAGDPAAALRHADAHQDLLSEDLGLRVLDSASSFSEQVRQELSREGFGDLAEVEFQTATVEARSWDLRGESAASGLSLSRSIAVLPFSDLSPNGDRNYLCEGMAEEIINALVHVDGVRVASRASAFRAWSQDADLATIGETLSVGRILQGSVRTAGGRLRVTAHLTDVDTDRHLWSERYDRSLEDVFAVQDEIATGVVQAVESQLMVESLLLQPPGSTPDELPLPALPVIPPRERARDVEAYKLYLRGRYLRYRKDDLSGALECFEGAVRRDPSYVAARLGVAETCAVSISYATLPPTEAYPRTIAQLDWVRDHRGVTSAGRAIEGWLAWQCDWDVGAAQAAFEEAIELDPGSLQRGWYSCLLATLGHRAFDEQVRTFQSLDPESPYVRAGVALALLNAGRVEQAIDQAHLASAMDPSSMLVTWVAGLCLAADEQWTASVERLERAADISGRSPLTLSSTGWAMGACGRQDEAHAILRELEDLSRERYVDPTCQAWVLSELDDADATRAKFEESLAGRSALLAWTQLPPNRRLAEQPEQAALIRKFRGAASADSRGTGSRPLVIAAGPEVTGRGSESDASNMTGSGRGPDRTRTLRRRWTLGTVSLAAAALLVWRLPGLLAPAPSGPPLHVVLADFEAPDSALSTTLTEALRVQLLEDDRLIVLPPELLHVSAEEPDLTAEGPIDADRARTLAQLNGAGAVLLGSVRRAGDAYIVQTSLVDPLTGAIPHDAAFQETAASADELLPSIERLAMSLTDHAARGSVDGRVVRPFGSVTTSSSEALHRYTDAQDALNSGGYTQRVADLLADAVEIDPMFASAHLQLGLVSWALHQMERSHDALVTANDLRDRLIPSERQTLEAEYRILVEGDVRGGIAAYEIALIDRPEDRRARGRLAHAYTLVRDWAAAERHYRAIVEAAPDDIGAWTLLAANQWRRGELEALNATMRVIDTRFGGDDRADALRASIRIGEGRFDEAEAILRALETRAERGPLFQARVAHTLAAVLAAQGRLREADLAFGRAATVYRDGGRPGNALATGAARAYLRVAVAADHDGARAILEDETARISIDSIPPLDRPYFDLAITYTALRDLDEARRLMHAYEASRENDFLGFEYEARRDLASGLIDLAAYDVTGSISKLRRSVVSSSCAICGLVQLGIALEHTGDREAAIDTYEEFLAKRWLDRAEGLPSTAGDGFSRGVVFQRLAALHDQAGNRDLAIRYYGHLAELWRDADSELQPRVAKALDRIRALEQGAPPLEIGPDGFFLERR